MKLEDGLAIYEQFDLTFWQFTEELERKAREMLKVLVDDNYKPRDSDKAEAHKLLDEIETWKSGCDKEKKGYYAIQNSPSDVWDALLRAMKAQKDLDALRVNHDIDGLWKNHQNCQKSNCCAPDVQTDGVGRRGLESGSYEETVGTEQLERR